MALVPFCALAQASAPTAPNQTVALSYSIPESLSFTLSTNSLALTNSTVGYQSILLTVSYNFAQARTLNAAAYFSSTTSALTAGSNIVTPGQVWSYQTPVGSISNPAPCSGAVVGTGGAAVGIAGATCSPLMNSLAIAAGIGTQTASEFLAVSGGTATAGNYTGTLNIAVAAL
jgi:hypothetical protein